MTGHTETATSTETETRSVALIGGRGHTGAELIRILDRHPSLSLAFASSREWAGEPVADHVEGVETKLLFADASPLDVAKMKYDVAILALPNNASDPFVEAFDEHSPQTILVDLSADHRFDDTWVYGLPEHFRASIRSAKRIANPGCYATGMQLAIRPVLEFLSGAPVVFGVSGYSGAGTTKSDRNDPEKLRDNLMPYALTGHVHEREAARHLGHEVRFHPHVAPFFRGITLTVSMPLRAGTKAETLDAQYSKAYGSEPLVQYVGDTPLVRDIAAQPYCQIGGLTVDEEGAHAVVIATIDNLLKGAATQAVQNINIACEFGEFTALI